MAILELKKKVSQYTWNSLMLLKSPKSYKKKSRDSEGALLEESECVKMSLSFEVIRQAGFCLKK